MLDFFKGRISSMAYQKLPCKAPLNNMVIDQFGKVKLCCYQKDVPLGYYPIQSLKDIWFSDARKQIVDTFLSGAVPDICGNCLSKGEFNQSPGSKIQTSKTFGKKQFEDYPDQIEFSLSNTCNLRCVMCSWDSSNQFAEMSEQQQVQLTYGDEFLKEIRPFLEHVKMTVFSGGEPFLIPFYYKIWDELSAINPSAEIYIQSNGTIFNDKIISLLNEKNVRIGLSIDAINEETFNRIRIGADYQQVFTNIHKFNKISFSTKRPLTLIVTPMTINVFEIPAIFDFCNQNEIMMGLSILEHPAELAIWSLNSTEILNVLKSLEKITPSSKGKTSAHIEWNQATLHYFIRLITQYYLQKRKNEESRNLIIEQINQKSAGAWDNFQKQLSSIDEADPNSSLKTKRISAIIEELFQQAREENSIPELGSIEDFFSLNFNPADLEVSLNKMGEKIFRENGRVKLKQLLFIFKTNSFDKLNVPRQY
jgi:MoaA/NifB/PqqE/SkfB family radical SAM enzyme